MRTEGSLVCAKPIAQVEIGSDLIWLLQTSAGGHPNGFSDVAHVVGMMNQIGRQTRRVSLWLTVVATVSPVAHPWDDHLFVLTREASSGNCTVMELDEPWTATVDVEPISSAAVVRHYFGRSYVVNEPTGTIQVIDPEIFDTVAELSVGDTSRPQDILLSDRETAYVSRYASCLLYKIDVATGALLTSVDLCPLADADGLPEMGLMARDGDRLFVQVRRLDPGFSPVPPSYLAVVDTATDQLIDVDPQQPGTQGIALTGLVPSYPMHVDPAARRLYVCTPGSPFEYETGGIDEVDLDTLSALGFLTSEVQIPLDMGPFVMVSESKGYVVTHTDIIPSSHLVPFSRIDGSPLGNEVYMAISWVDSMAFDAQTSQLFFPDPSAGGVVVIDTVSDTVLSAAPIDTGGYPADLAVVRHGEIFSDGFESGDTERWSSTVP